MTAGTTRVPDLETNCLLNSTFTYERQGHVQALGLTEYPLKKCKAENTRGQKSR